MYAKRVNILYYALHSSYTVCTNYMRANKFHVATTALQATVRFPRIHTVNGYELFTKYVRREMNRPRFSLGVWYTFEKENFLMKLKLQWMSLIFDCKRENSSTSFHFKKSITNAKKKILNELCIGISLNQNCLQNCLQNLPKLQWQNDCALLLYRKSSYKTFNQHIFKLVFIHFYGVRVFCFCQYQ